MNNARQQAKSNTDMKPNIMNAIRRAFAGALCGALLLGAAQPALAWGDTKSGGPKAPPQTIAAMPYINVTYTPAQPVAGQSFRTSWTAGAGNYVSYNCVAAGTGLNDSGDMGTGSGFVDRVAQAGWVGYPSTCTWTADNGTDYVDAVTTLVTVAGSVPAPTLTVTRSPSTMTAGRDYTLTWSTADATSLTRSCTTSGSGFASSGAMTLQGSQSGTAAVGWVGYPSNCTWTATGSGGTKTVTETMTTIAAPTISNLVRTPSTMTSGAGYTLTWNTADAVSLNRSCTSSGTGFTSNGAMALQGPQSGTALAGWVGYPSNCTWTATNAAGASVTAGETMTTVAAAVPTITVNPRTPSPMIAGQGYTLTWSTTNATSLTRQCTATTGGFISSGTMALQGPETGTALSSWVGKPSTCTWTATGAGGQTATANETMTTVASAAPAVTYIHTDGLGSPVARTNAAGAVISETRYEPYGLTASGATPTIGFTGHVNDADTGLTYMQQRYYDPVAGRFLSIDPVTTDVNTGGSFNRYNYANNCPYKFVDPDGRAPDFFGQQGPNLGPLKQIWHGFFGPDRAPSSNADAKLEVGAAYGIGIEFEQSLSSTAGSISFLPVAEGLSAGVFVQPKEGYEVKLGKGNSPVTFKAGGEVKGGFILVGAVEAEINPGGTLTVTPKAGVGAGELVKYGPSIKIFEWGKKESEKPVKTEEKKDGKQQ